MSMKGPVRIFKHIKSQGVYRVWTSNAILEGTHKKLVVYQNEDTYEVWARPKKEFYDGRFKEIHK